MTADPRSNAWLLVVVGIPLTMGGCLDSSDEPTSGLVSERKPRWRDHASVPLAAPDSALAARIDSRISPPLDKPADAVGGTGALDRLLQAPEVPVARSRARAEAPRLALGALDEAPVDLGEPASPALGTTLLSCPTIPGSPFTDCACPDGSTVVGGGGYAPGRLVLKESRPLNATMWRLACQTVAGDQVACAVDEPGSAWIVCAQVN